MAVTRWAKLGLLPAVLTAGDISVHGRGLGIFYHVVALASLCWVSGPVLRDEATGQPVSPGPDAIQGLLMAHGSIYRAVSDWAWGEQADWSAEGNVSGPPSSDAGPAAAPGTADPGHPHTGIGRLIMHHLASPGAWQRAGLGGLVCGVCWTALLRWWPAIRMRPTRPASPAPPKPPC